MKYVGRQMVDFYNDKGEHVVGVKLHLIGLDSRVEGEACITQFFKVEHPLYNDAMALPYGEVDIVYGRRNSVQAIRSSK